MHRLNPCPGTLKHRNPSRKVVLMPSMARSLVVALVLAGTTAACTPHQVSTYMIAKTSGDPAAAAAADRAVADWHNRRSADCYEAIDRHWPAASRAWARGIVWRESRNNPAAANTRSTARGCWQLLLGTHGRRFAKLGFSTAQWADPDVNTLVALDLYREAGTSPWRL